jgi:hypothetical protein
MVMETHPVRRWELEPAKQDGWFTNLKRVEIRVDRRHFQPWLTNVSDLGEYGVAVESVPPLPKDEFYRPSALNTLPQVFVRFIDPDLKNAPPWTDWSAFATWMYTRYAPLASMGPVAGPAKGTGQAGLASLAQWMAKELQYRQVYLTPERGWIPLDALEVGRRRYGDCKDLSCFLMANAKDLHFAAFPCLARIGTGEVEAEAPPSLAFNHVITALRLDRSFGLASEVETAQGRFLLIDPTDRFTPMGFLGMAHRNGRVMICTEKGGIWVVIPPEAIQPSKVAVRLQGEADGKGVLKGTIQLQETGSGWGLRRMVQEDGLQKTRVHLLTNLFDLPPTAAFEITRTGNPLDLAGPFAIELEVRHPEGFRTSGGEASLAPLGWVISPAQAQKPGVARQYPVQQNVGAEFEFSATVKVSGVCSPILGAKTEETPFRTFIWNARADVDGEGSKLTLHLQHRLKDAFFDFDHREEGVAAAKKDRSMVRNLVADGLAFKVRP